MKETSGSVINISFISNDFYDHIVTTDIDADILNICMDIDLQLQLQGCVHR